MCYLEQHRTGSIPVLQDLAAISVMSWGWVGQVSVPGIPMAALLAFPTAGRQRRRLNIPLSPQFHRDTPDPLNIICWAPKRGC